MDKYKKLLEYEEMLRDGVISGAEAQKLKAILISQTMAELGVQDEAECEEMLKREAYREAVLILEKNESKRFKEAFYVLENLGDWGDASDVIRRYQKEYDAVKKQDEQDKAEQVKNELLEKETLEKDKKKKKTLIIGIACAVVAVLLVMMLSGNAKCNQYEDKLAGHTYRDGSFVVRFESDGTYDASKSGDSYWHYDGNYSVKKSGKDYYVQISQWGDYSGVKLYIMSETSDGAPAYMRGELGNGGVIDLQR